MRTVHTCRDLRSGTTDNGEVMTDESDMKQPAAIHVSDVSALPEADREVIARFEAALLGVCPAPGSDEAAAVATMNRFLDGLREAQAVARAAGVWTSHARRAPRCSVPASVVTRHTRRRARPHRSPVFGSMMLPGRYLPRQSHQIRQLPIVTGSTRARPLAVACTSTTSTLPNSRACAAR